MECLPLAGLMKNRAGDEEMAAAPDDPDSLDAPDAIDEDEEGPLDMALLDLQGLTWPMQETVGEVGSSSSSFASSSAPFSPSSSVYLPLPPLALAENKAVDLCPPPFFFTMPSLAGLRNSNGEEVNQESFSLALLCTGSGTGTGTSVHFFFLLDCCCCCFYFSEFISFSSPSTNYGEIPRILYLWMEIRTQSWILSATIEIPWYVCMSA